MAEVTNGSTKHDVTPELAEAIKYLKQFVRRLIITLVAVLVAAVLTFGYLLHRTEANTHKATVAAERAAVALVNQRAAIYGGCHRQNRRQIASNLQSRASYNFFSAAVSLFDFGLKTSPAPLSVTAQERHGVALTNGLLAVMVRSVRDKTWTPLANCTATLNHPGTYVPPGPVLFSKELPPRSAFVIGKNE